MLKQLTCDILVAPQIDVETVAQARAQGATLVINNRPEGEAPDQTPGAVIEAAARAAGMAYVAIPVGHGGFAPWQLDALDAALADKGEGLALCYCRSGTRSTLLWALARARAGDDVQAIAEMARAAGYDVTPIWEMMQALAAR